MITDCSSFCTVHEREAPEGRGHSKRSQKVERLYWWQAIVDTGETDNIQMSVDSMNYGTAAAFLE